jgi:hypothetical protein
MPLTERGNRKERPHLLVNAALAPSNGPTVLFRAALLPCCLVALLSCWRVAWPALPDAVLAGQLCGGSLQGTPPLSRIPSLIAYAYGTSGR